MLSNNEWQAKRDDYLPSEKDVAYVESLMVCQYEPGKIAGWIAEPKTGINRQSFDFPYVRFADQE